ncbi:MAG: hypothetical protein ACOX9E_06205 [Lentisphaeria bacterium]|jgi:hypothetical protein
MDWTTETPRTAGNDTLDSGDWLADAGDREAPPARETSNLRESESAKKPAAWLGRAAAMRDMPLIICVNLRNLRIKNVCYQSVTAYKKISKVRLGCLHSTFPQLAYSLFLAKNDLARYSGIAQR